MARRQTIEDEVERIEQAVASRPAKKRGKKSLLPQNVLDAIETEADKEYAEWWNDFNAAAEKLTEEIDA